MPADLRTLRKQLGLTQAELAVRLDVTRETISEHERGKRPVPQERMMAVLYLVVLASAQAKSEITK